jgi:two-component system chemotaxis response regulator CheB
VAAAPLTGSPLPGGALPVVIVADTAVRQGLLGRLLSAQDLRVCGTARDAARALALVSAHRPRAVLLDIAPHAGGLEVVEQLMARCPLPIVLTGPAARDPGPAMAAGALDAVAPDTEGLGQGAYGQALARHLHLASRVRVITHPRGRLPRSAALPGRGAATVSRLERAPGRLPVVAIGASTGGPPALAAILGALPAGLPAAVLVVQHMADGFVSSLAAWLDSLVGSSVTVARHGARLRAGQVLLAPSNANLELGPGVRVRLTEPRPDQLHVPEVDSTFRSVAQTCGSAAVGVLLTGMGRDGAAGLLQMRHHGAYTIGQDEPTSAVWGMPGAARSLDAVTAELALPDIAAGVVAAVDRIVRSEPA